MALKHSTWHGIDLKSYVGNAAAQRLLAQRSADAPFDLDDATAGRIHRARSGGQALDGAMQAQMSQALGHDFSSVRIHIDGEAHALNQQLNARAFTTGADIFFRSGAYSPQSSAGQELLAHELTHVIQQASGAVDGGGAGMRVNAPGDRFEQEADAVAHQVNDQASVAGCNGIFSVREHSPGTNTGKMLSAYDHTCAVQKTSTVQREVQRQAAMHPDPGCEDLLARILARLVELKERAQALVHNPLNLPQSGPMSIEGHQQQFRNKQTNLRRMLNQWDTNNCGPGYVPQQAWEWATRSTPNPNVDMSSSRRTTEPPRDGTQITPGDVAVGIGTAAMTIGAGYVIYRAVRMLPSLLPPLWWTIPANAAVP